MIKSKWIDRALIISPVFYTLCTDESDFYRLMKNIKMPIVDQPEFMIAGSGATTHTFRTEEYPVAIVCMNLDNDATNAQLSAMIAHEAVHVFQYILDCIGETDPSVEFEAYSIQMITQQLILEYERQRDLVHGNQANKD